MAACGAGTLPSVKLLVRRDAKTYHVKGDRIMNVIDAARHHQAVRRWLLVEPFMGVLKLPPSEEIAWPSRDIIFERWMR